MKLYALHHSELRGPTRPAAPHIAHHLQMSLRQLSEDLESYLQSLSSGVVTHKDQGGNVGLGPRTKARRIDAIPNQANPCGIHPVVLHHLGPNHRTVDDQWTRRSTCTFIDGPNQRPSQSAPLLCRLSRRTASPCPVRSRPRTPLEVQKRTVLIDGYTRHRRSQALGLPHHTASASTQWSMPDFRSGRDKAVRPHIDLVALAREPLDEAMSHALHAPIRTKPTNRDAHSHDTPLDMGREPTGAPRNDGL